MKKIESAKYLNELDTFSMNLSRAVNALFAIHVAIEADVYRADEFKDGLYHIFCTLDGYSKELRSAVDRAFEEARQMKL